MKQKLAIILDGDLLLAEGKKEEMLGNFQTKLGKTKVELNKFILIKKHMPRLIKFYPF